jgi:hypothetical protein
VVPAGATIPAATTAAYDLFRGLLHAGALEFQLEASISGSLPATGGAPESKSGSVGGGDEAVVAVAAGTAVVGSIFRLLHLELDLGLENHPALGLSMTMAVDRVHRAVAVAFAAVAAAAAAAAVRAVDVVVVLGVGTASMGALAAARLVIFCRLIRAKKFVQRFL